MRRGTLLVVAAALVALWLYATRRAATSAIRLSAPLEATSLFDRADRDADGLLSPAEFALATAELSQRPSHAKQSQSPLTLSPQTLQLLPPQQAPIRIGGIAAADPAAAAAAVPPASISAAFSAAITASTAWDARPPPQCSLLFFYHIVKTAGTTMRTVLQRQAQLGDFEYIYSDTTRKPRWMLLMHQLSHPVARRRMIVELHSEWGLPRSFYADIKRIRKMYEPLGCTVTLATVLRHPLSFYLSWFNWRASNYMPLCLWDPPRDPQSRQLSGFGLPFVTARQPDAMGGRRLRLPVESVLSTLAQFDVVGLTERFDESLLVMGKRAGLRHLGYARLAENLKPEHPKLAKRVLEAVLRDAGVSAGLNASFDFESVGPGQYQRSGGSGGAAGSSAWSRATLDAVGALDDASMRWVIAKNARRREGPEKADCNFYPCAEALSQANGYVSSELCSGKVTPTDMLHQMLDKTTTDRAVHSYVVQKLDASIAALDKEAAAAGGPALGLQLATLRAQSADVQQRRTEQIGERREKLCGVRLCGTPLRSCVGCEPNPVPGLEPCWPSWEDQFSPDERKVWCRRMMTIPGYDALELKERTFPTVKQIPCWRTCWETMTPNATQPHNTNPTCLESGAPSPSEGGLPGPSCAKREVHCSPGCTQAYQGTLKAFWDEWTRHPDRPKDDDVGIQCPCGQGG